MIRMLWFPALMMTLAVAVGCTAKEVAEEEVDTSDLQEVVLQVEGMS